METIVAIHSQFFIDTNATPSLHTFINSSIHSVLSSVRSWVGSSSRRESAAASSADVGSLSPKAATASGRQSKNRQNTSPFSPSAVSPQQQHEHTAQSDHVDADDSVDGDSAADFSFSASTRDQAARLTVALDDNPTVCKVAADVVGSSAAGCSLQQQKRDDSCHNNNNKSRSKAVAKVLKAPECCICLSQTCNVGFCPCGHIVTCEGCAQSLLRSALNSRTSNTNTNNNSSYASKCPLCRTPIQTMVVLETDHVNTVLRSVQRRQQ